MGFASSVDATHANAISAAENIAGYSDKFNLTHFHNPKLECGEE